MITWKGVCSHWQVGGFFGCCSDEDVMQNRSGIISCKVYPQLQSSACSILELIFKWKASLFSRRGKLLWKRVLHSVLWCPRRERNRRIFDGASISAQKLIVQNKELVWLWALDEPEMNGTKREDVIFSWELVLVTESVGSTVFFRLSFDIMKTLFMFLSLVPL